MSARVLIVDSDQSSLNLLTRGLSRFGLSSAGAAGVDQALAALAAHKPDAVVSGMDGDAGLRVLEQLRRDPATRDVPMLFLAKGQWARQSAQVRDLGAQELLAKPAFIQDVAVLTWLHAGHPAGSQAFEGTFGDPSSAALLRSLLASGRSGTLFLAAASEDELGSEGATVRFREGAVVEAECPPFHSERALLRILTLGTGSYELTFEPIDAAAQMHFDLQDLQGRGLAHVREWGKVVTELQPLDRVLTLNFEVLARHLAQLPSGLRGLLQLFDGKRTLAAVIADAPLDDVTAGRSIAKLVKLSLFAIPGTETWDATTPPSERRTAAARAHAELEGRPAEEPTLVHERKPLLLSADLEVRGEATAADQTAVADFERAFFEGPLETSAEDQPTALHAEAAKPSAFRQAYGAAAVILISSLLLGLGVVAWRNTDLARTPAGTKLARSLADLVPERQTESAPTAAPAAAVPAVAPSAVAPTAAPPAPAPTSAKEAEAAAPVRPEAAVPEKAVEAAPAKTAETAPKAGAAELLAKGQKEYDRGRLPLALNLFNQAETQAPDDPAVELARGLTLYDLGKLDAAVVALTRALKIDPKSARAELLLGAIAQERGLTGTARNHYQRYLELEPTGEHASEVHALLEQLGKG